MRFMHLFAFFCVGKRFFAKNNLKRVILRWNCVLCIYLRFSALENVLLQKTSQNALFYAENAFYAFICVFLRRKTFLCKKQAKTRYFTLKIRFMHLLAFFCVGKRFFCQKPAKTSYFTLKVRFRHLFAFFCVEKRSFLQKTS